MNHQSKEILELLWTQSWQVGLLICVVSIVVRFVIRGRTHLAYLLWMLVVLKCLTPPIVSSPMGVFGWVGRRESGAIAKYDAAPGGFEPAMPALSGASQGAQDRFAETSFVPKPSTSIAAQNDKQRWMPVISWESSVVVVWMIGCGALAVITLVAWLGCWRRAMSAIVSTPIFVSSMLEDVARQLGIRRKVRVVVTAETIGPAVTGVFRPVVILPQGMLAEMRSDQIRPLLAHELIHIRRGDVMFGLLQSVAQALLWFHPLVWWANRQASNAVEHCCDEEAIAGLEYPPASYARSLLDAVQFTGDLHAIPTFPGIGPRTRLARRLESIMKRKSEFRRRMPAGFWVLLVALCALILPGHAWVTGQTTSGQTTSASSGEITKGDNAQTGTTIVGQVLDSTGKPARGVAVYAFVRSPTREQWSGPAHRLAEGRTDDSGKFRLVGPAIFLPRDVMLTVAAYQAGSALAWKQLDIGPNTYEATLQFQKEQPIEVQVKDGDGKPVVGAKLELHCVGRNFSGQKLLFKWDVLMFPDGPNASVANAAVTDGEGCAMVQGVLRGDLIWVDCYDPRFAPESTNELKTDDGRAAITLCSPQAVKGTVSLQKTGEIVGGALVKVTSWHKSIGGGGMYLGAVETHTDAKGQFHLVPYHADLLSVFVTASGHGTFELIDWQDAEKVFASEQKLSIPNGVVIDGTVVDDASGKPISGAEVTYESSTPTFGLIEAMTDAAGQFVITAQPGHGALFVQGPTADFIKQTTTTGQAIYGYDQPGGMYLHPDGVVALNPTSQTTEQKVTIKLRRGVTVRGRAIGADGKPVARGKVITNACGDVTKFSRDWAIPIRDGWFAMPGLDPEKEYRVYVIDPDKQCGATAMLPANGTQPVEIHLAACGSASARLVDQNGHPYASEKLDRQPYVHVSLIEAPGVADNRQYDGKQIGFEEYMMENADPDRYHDLQTDGDGRITFPSLIPGADYRLLAWNQGKSGNGKKDFTVRAGEMVELGEIKAER
jgi:beta-lactamase regulating signal transducer with metallopeptidase domain/uncharacterized GH25 family protein